MMENIFSDDFLSNLSRWQGGWRNQASRRLIADDLVKLCAELPPKFRTVKGAVYRKRFIISGEVVPIILDDDFFEGIASWSTDLNYTKKFKGIVKEETAFTMVFRHFPKPEEVVLNIAALWTDKDFRQAAGKFREARPEEAEYLFGFRDSQSEVILRSTLKGSEIEDIVGMSKSFEELCDMAGVPEEERNALSLRFGKEGIPIEEPVFAGSGSSRRAVNATVRKIKAELQYYHENNIPIDWSRVAQQAPEDLKHKL